MGKPQSEYWNGPWPVVMVTPPDVEDRLREPSRVAGGLAGTWITARPNASRAPNGGNDWNNHAYTAVLAGQTVAQPYQAKPNGVTYLPTPVRGSVAEAQFIAQIRALQNTVPGRP